MVCARSFQAAVACVNAARGNLLWSRNVGGTQGVAANAQTVVAADASDRVTAWRAATGEVAWTSEALLHREVSAPALLGSAAVAFGDAQGTVHVLSLETGKTLARLPTAMAEAFAERPTNFAKYPIDLPRIEYHEPTSGR